jgi:hypothetical protein
MQLLEGPAKIAPPSQAPTHPKKKKKKKKKSLLACCCFGQCGVAQSGVV